MDMILISGEKLKVTLTESDMEEMHIDAESLDYGCVETKKMFWSLLDKAKSLTGFDADRTKLYVQVFPDRAGGCEMYITKAGGEKDGEKDGEASSGSGSFAPKRRRAAGKHAESACFCVRLDFEALLRLCRRLKDSGAGFSSSLYLLNTEEERGRDDACYLLLLRRALPSYMPSAASECAGAFLPPYLSEYGEGRLLREYELPYLSERAERIVCEDAVEKLSGLT